MKKFLALMLVFLLLMALSACHSAETNTAPAPTEEAPIQTEPVPETTQTEPIMDKPLQMLSYNGVLDSYYNALMEKWAPEKYMEAGMNYLPGLIGDAAKVGYYLEDLDGDGFPELLIGEVGKRKVFVMYTMVDRSPLTVLRASERNTYYLTEDGVFYNLGSNGAAFTGHMFYSFENGGMRYQDALMFNSDADPENPWFYSVDEDWDVSNDLAYGTGDAEAYIQMVEQSIVEIPYVPFSEYMN